MCSSLSKTLLFVGSTGALQFGHLSNKKHLWVLQKNDVDSLHCFLKYGISPSALRQPGQNITPLLVDKIPFLEMGIVNPDSNLVFSTLLLIFEMLMPVCKESCFRRYPSIIWSLSFLDNNTACKAST